MDYSNKKIKLPKLVQLDEEKYCYLYLNNFNTYFYTKSAFLGSNKSINDDKYDLDECKLNESLGLFFCGKNIEYNNENIICSPNNMICKKCMEKNKRRYNLKSKYLININGRVSKKTKDEDREFHCFGHFLIGKIQIENCIDKFCCEACKLLGKYMNGVIYSEELVISEFTLALLEDTGYYKANYYTGGLMRFGKGKGCDFLKKDA
jgi:hypothetical protein